MHNLFFNTPVRRKFLRTTATEFGHVSEAFTRIALASPQVHFTLRHNDKPIFDLAAGDGWLDRIGLFFGRELAENLIWVESVEDDVSISGYAAHPGQSRSHNRMQYFFLNGRCIRDRALQHALGEAYRGLMMVGRQPIAFLTMTMPPELVDVNVHPTKLEVRFQDSGRLYSQLLATLRGKFLTTDLNTHVHTAGDQLPSPFGRGAGGEGDDPTGGHDAAQTVELRQQLVDWAKGKVASWGTGRSEVRGQGQDDNSRGPTARGESPATSPRSLGSSPPRPPWPLAASSPTFGESGVKSPARLREGAGDGHAALQIHNRYLVTETEEGVTIIDQHALHERILYEQLKQRVAAGAIETQNLLVPEPVDLSPAETSAALEHRELLAELGVKVEPFGGNTLLLAGYPAMLANISPVEVLRACWSEFSPKASSPTATTSWTSCCTRSPARRRSKPAIASRRRRSRRLLEQRHLVADAHHCPHGRPTALVFTREELDKQFKRV